MKKILLFLVLYAHSGFVLGVDDIQIAPGMRYVHVQETSPQLISTHVLTIDPSRIEIMPVLAGQVCFGLSQTSKMAQKFGAIAAINGGFSDTHGAPSGALKIADQWYSDTKCSRGALGWSGDGKSFLIDKIQVQVTLEVHNKKFYVDRVNQVRSPGKAILYSPFFGQTTGTDKNGTDIVIIDNKVACVLSGAGDTQIPANGFVYSLDAQSSVNFKEITVGDIVKISWSVLPVGERTQAQWLAMDFIVGGAPVLVYNGQKIEDFSSEKIMQNFIDDRFARTAVGILPNGDWVFVVIDKKSGLSDGMTLYELATFMYNLGVIYALNLSGGLSATLYLEQEGVVSSSLGWIGNLGVLAKIFVDEEKLVSDAIVMKSRNFINE